MAADESLKMATTMNDHRGPRTEDDVEEKFYTETSDGSTQDVSKLGADSPADDVQDTADPGSLDENKEYIGGMKLAAVVIAVTLCCFLMLLDVSILSTAIPVITNDFHALKDIGWYVSAYQLTMSAIQPLTGKFFTYFSSKWTFFTFLAIFELGSLLCGVSTSSTMLIIGRAVSGLGGSGLFNGALTIVAGSVPLEKRPGITGIVMGFCQIGLIAGPLIGGSLAQYSTWRWCFYINLPIGGCAAVMMAFIHIPDQVEKPTFKSVMTDKNVWQKFDITGSLIFIPTVVMLLLALHFGGNEYPWKSATVIGLFCGFGGMIVIFALWEYRAGDHAMVPFSMVRNRVVFTSCVAIGLLFSSMFCATYFLPIYFQAILNATPFLSGVYMLPSIIPQIIFAVISGVLVSKLGYYLPWMIFSTVTVAISSGLVSTFSPTTSTAKWIGYQILMGAGRGSGMQMAIIAVQTVLPASQLSVAMALTVFMQNLCGAIFISAANTLFDTSLESKLTENVPDVNPENIVAAGATEFRKFVTTQDLPGVLQAYATSVDRVFYLASALAVVSFVSAWGMGWNDVRKKRRASSGDV